MTDPMFRQRLRIHYRDLKAQWAIMERGTPEWFDCEKAIGITQRLHLTMFREAIDPVHSSPPGDR